VLSFFDPKFGSEVRRALSRAFHISGRVQLKPRMAEAWELSDEALLSMPEFAGNGTSVAPSAAAGTSGAAVPHYVASLNAAQRDAVLAPIDQPLQILAGAGSGKTSVLTARIQHMLASGIPASRVLALTFTKAAAEEMRERLQRAVGPTAEKVTISTFHALSLALCRSYADAAGRPRDFKVWTTRQQINAVRKALAELRVATAAEARPQLPQQPLLPVSMAAQAPAPVAPDDEAAAGVTTAAAAAKSSADPSRLLTSIMHAKARGQAVADGQLRTVYERYTSLMLQANAFDMLDFLLVATAALRGSAEARAAVHRRHTHVLVDEFQDTNALQLELLRLLVKPADVGGDGGSGGGGGCLTVVGDDDQAIYGFQGASGSFEPYRLMSF
jgi:DNA helicase-2/ATP-dependent DNA helicase PcrA